MPSLAASSILTLTILCHLSMILVQAVSNDGQNELTMDDRNDILDQHNEFRAGVHPEASDMRKLKWNYDLEMIAHLWADVCKFAHGRPTCTDVPFNSTGQNIHMTYRTILDVAHAVTSWHNEVYNYTYSTNTCEAKPCGHYTQVVWANTQEVGCGIKKCPSMVPPAIIFVCNYAAAGNYAGERPYNNGTVCTDCPSDHESCESNLCTKAETGYYTIPTTKPATSMKCEGDDSGVNLPQLSITLVLLISVLNMELLGFI